HMLPPQPRMRQASRPAHSPRSAMGAAANHAGPNQRDFSGDKLMYKASRSAKVRIMKSSVECWRACRVFAFWQACLLGGVLLLPSTGFAQLSTASLTGAVRDSSGAVVAKGKVVLKNVATNVEHTTTTNDAGAYFFLSIAPGSYVVSASAQGFGAQRV